MQADVAIIHGWSDSSRSFHDLRDFLKRNGYEVRPIWLGDYVSMDDDVRVPDVAKRMHGVLGELIDRGELAVPFDLIVHSTGGLVAREWVATFYPDGAGCPARKIIMLAPANFGSRLAAKGKSMIGRLAKGWNNWFQTGQEMLKNLELASPYQWRLATRDLVDPDGDGRPGPYGKGRIWPFVIAGTRGYSGGLREIVNERGADGTVRPAAANLNVVGMTIDFSTGASQPSIRPWASRVAGPPLPMAILPDRDHSSIVRPDEKTSPDGEGTGLLGKLIMAALECESEERYAQLAQQWYEISEATQALRHALPEDAEERGDFHQYMQFVVRARDDHGHPVDDYFLEFFCPEMKGNRDCLYFHKSVLEHVHTNSVSPSLRCLFVDRTDLIEKFYRLARTPERQTLAVSVSAAQLGRNVRYFDKTHEGARGQVVIHALAAAARDDLDARVRRNSTHLIEMILPRQPVDKLFKLAR